MFSVIPAQAGIQSLYEIRILWIPIFTGMTTFHETILLRFGNLLLTFSPLTLALSLLERGG